MGGLIDDLNDSASKRSEQESAKKIGSLSNCGETATGNVLKHVICVEIEPASAGFPYQTPNSFGSRPHKTSESQKIILLRAGKCQIPGVQRGLDPAFWLIHRTILVLPNPAHDRDPFCSGVHNA